VQKIWKQIGLHQVIWGKLDFFKQENALTTDGDAIKELLVQNERFKIIMNALEKKAQETEEWKQRAEQHLKVKK